MADSGEITIEIKYISESVNGPEDSRPVPGRTHGIPGTKPRKVKRENATLRIFSIKNNNKLISEMILKFFNFNDDNTSFMFGSSTKISILLFFHESMKIQKKAEENANTKRMLKNME